jgi:hypothetical protein
MKGDCRLATGLPQQPTLSVVKLEGGPAASVKPGQKSCVIKSIKTAYTLSARSIVKHLLKGDEAAGLHIVSVEPSAAPTEGLKASDQNHVGVTYVARQCKQETHGST